MDKVVLLAFTAALNLTLVTAINKLDYSPAVTVLVVIGFNLIMLEAPLLAFAIAPRRRPRSSTARRRGRECIGGPLRSRGCA